MIIPSNMHALLNMGLALIPETARDHWASVLFCRSVKATGRKLFGIWEKVKNGMFYRNRIGLAESLLHTHTAHTPFF